MTGRESLWLALSELWLDVPWEAHQHNHLARLLIDSGLPCEELDAIYLFEVAPRVWGNQWVPAGVWDGFDPDWLLEGCRHNQLRRQRAWFRGLCRLFRRPMTYAVEADWRQLMAQVEAAQSPGG